MALVRLQKYFTDCGVMSRRAAEEQIRLGRVYVNGKPAAVGDSVEPGRDVVEYEGKIIIPMCDEKVRARLIKVLLKLNLPCEISTVDAERIIKACRNDKKLQGDEITLVYVPEVGSFDFLKMPFSQYERMLREVI